MVTGTSTPPDTCDVVVMGGGPGGSIAATLLAAKGYDVVLLEKRRHPRYAVGESLIPHFWKYCKAAGVVEKIEREGFIAKAGGTMLWRGVIRQTAFARFGYPKPALHVERDRFDHILLEHARETGARVYEDVAATSADVDGGDAAYVTYLPTGVTETGRIRSRYVIDATGQNALLARQLGAREIDEGFKFMSIWGYFEGSKYVALGGRAHAFEELAATPPTTFVEEVPATGGWGWAWHIPLRRTTSVGLVVPREFMKSSRGPREDVETFFLRSCLQTNYVKRLLEGAKLTPGSVRMVKDYSYLPSRLVGPRYFLVGDAAAFTDPIFSIGIIHAMYSGCLAAWAIDGSLSNPACAARNRDFYASQVNEKILLTRALALPKYSGEGDSNEVRSALAFQSARERRLMNVVSEMTTRSKNYAAITGASGDATAESEGDAWRIEEIMF